MGAQVETTSTAEIVFPLLLIFFLIIFIIVMLCMTGRKRRKSLKKLNRRVREVGAIGGAYLEHVAAPDFRGESMRLLLDAKCDYGGSESISILYRFWTADGSLYKDRC